MAQNENELNTPSILAKLDFADKLLQFGFSMLGRKGECLIVEGQHFESVVTGLSIRTLQLFESAIFLIEKGKAYDAFVLVRSLFENYVYLAYLLEKNSEYRYRALLFLRSYPFIRSRNYKELKKLHKRAKESGDSYSIKQIESLQEWNLLDSEVQKYEQKLCEIDKLLSNLKVSFQNDIKKPLEPSGKNRRDTCADLGLDFEVEYEVFYRSFSRYTHPSGEGVLENIDIRDDSIHPKYGTAEEMVHEALKFACWYFLRILGTIYMMWNPKLGKQIEAFTDELEHTFGFTRIE